MQGEEGDRIIGVRKNADGTRDYSKAATMMSGGNPELRTKIAIDNARHEAARFAIPETAVEGSADRVWYELRNAMYRLQDSKNILPGDEETKARAIATINSRIADLERQQHILSVAQTKARNPDSEGPLLAAAVVDPVYEMKNKWIAGLSAEQPREQETFMGKVQRVSDLVSSADSLAGKLTIASTPTAPPSV